MNVGREQLGQSFVQKMEMLALYVENLSTNFLVGPYPSYADFMLFELCSRIQFISEGALFNKFQSLNNYGNRIALLPQITRYLQFDSTFMDLPFNNRNAKINDRH